MIKEVAIEDEVYKITDEEEFDGTEEEIVFEIEGELVVGEFDDMLGAPIDKVWKIIK